MEKQAGLVHETGNVNELLIENPGDFDLFIQAGDIVKGGRQDRTLGADFIVPAKSGKVPIPVFCVEASRWHKRPSESAVHFSGSSDYASSKKLRAAINQKKSQGEVWASVEEEQAKLSASIGLCAKSAMSPSSLQLSYEMKETTAAVEEYLRGLETRVSLVRDLPAGAGVSYGRTFLTDRPIRAAVLAAGYADGFPRQVSGRGACVLIRGARCPVLGRVTMDQIVVDVTAAGEIEAGEEEDIIGKQGGESITAEELAAQAGTISWHILTGITGRVARISP